MKAIGLVSFGLDSLLACHFVAAQGIEPLLYYLAIGFSKRDIHSFIQGRTKQRILGRAVAAVNLFARFKPILFQPAHGYGKNLNPCIDCKILMLRTAGRLMVQQGAEFIFTGEVKGQRPMSQMPGTLALIERRAGVAGKVLRPLSAKVLPATEMERRNVLDPRFLFAISGRERKRQLAMAREVGISPVPAPGGGCLLTDPRFSQRLKRAMHFYGAEGLTQRIVCALRLGRQFFFHHQAHAVLGRNEQDNTLLAKLAGNTPCLFPEDQKGPMALVFMPQGPASGVLETVAAVVRSYSDNDVPVVVTEAGRVVQRLKPVACSRETIKQWLV